MMKAAVHDRYGPPEVVTIRDIPDPMLGDGDVLVRVVAASVTTADWRLRASAFPRFAWLPGRLVLGMFRPRQGVLGGEFSGVVVATGALVTRFSLGDPVVGFSVRGGAHAEYIKVRQDGVICAKPANLSHELAACLPFGGLTSLVFLRDFARLEPGQRVLVVGASGGVGTFAVQLAKHFGAEVTGICSGRNADFVRALGADHVIDYQQAPITSGGRTYDLILDTVGRLAFSQARPMLSQAGIFIPLEFDFREIFQYLGNAFRTGPRILIGMSGDRREDLETLVAMASQGALRPQIDTILPLAQIADAHRRTESRHKRGSVVISISPEPR